MATDESSDDLIYIKKTQEILGKHVKKPVLSEKLLKKPPFRFLHDVVNMVIKDVPSLNGLYSKSELNSDNIKDRDGKITFLQKLIDVIKIVTKENVTARPSKIVAGHEADKTNELLQLLGKIVDKKLDCSKAVEEIVGKPEVLPTKPINKLKTTKESTSKVKEKKIKSTEDEKVQAKSKILKKVNSKDGDGKQTSKDIKEKLPSKSLKSKEVDKQISKVSKSDKIDSENGKKIDPKSRVGAVSKTKTPKLSKTAENGSKVSAVSLSNESEETSKNTSKPSDQSESKSKHVEQNANPELSVSQTVFMSELNKKPTEITKPPNKVRSAEKRRKTSKHSEQLNLALEINHKIPENSTADSRKSSAVSRKSSLENSSLQLMPKDSSDSGLQMLKENTNEEKLVESIPTPLENENEKPVIQNSTKMKEKPAVIKRESTFTRDEPKENITVTRPKTSLRPPSVRPPSARPGAPRRREKSNVEIILRPNDQQKIGGIDVKLETFNTELEDDGENLVIIENLNMSEIENDTFMKSNNNILDDDAEQKGHLVQQILETQKELVQTSAEIQDSKKEIDFENETNRKTYNSGKEIEKLREIIQNLTRSINPLGKLMDFIPEDIDAMQLELTMWHDNYVQAASELKKEKSLTESAVEPLKNQLTQINTNIKEYKDMIDASNAKILKNSEKIQQLLTE